MPFYTSYVPFLLPPARRAFLAHLPLTCARDVEWKELLLRRKDILLIRKAIPFRYFTRTHDHHQDNKKQAPEPLIFLLVHLFDRQPSQWGINTPHQELLVRFVVVVHLD